MTLTILDLGILPQLRATPIHVNLAPSFSVPLVRYKSSVMFHITSRYLFPGPIGKVLEGI